MKAPSLIARAVFAVIACAGLVLAFFGDPRPVPAAADPSPTLPPYTSLTPVRVLGIIRRVYRMHRPPPPYETYTLVRREDTNYGYPDPLGTYTVHYWVRNSDRAALMRRVYRDDYDGDMNFDRPALNQPRDPGPPTADLFEPAHPQPINVVPTPEPTNGPLKTIGSVVAIGESDYRVPKMTVEGDQLDLVLDPRRDPERNVLREIWVDKKTYMLKKVIAHDRMFVEQGHTYPMKVTYSLGYLDGYVVITHIDAVVLPRKERVGNEYQDISDFGDETGDADSLEIDFKDIMFPKTLPDWYFDPKQYGSHLADAPL
ncbi:MAG TPA: hypothetical protein VFH72_12410 [Candidatus Baltobacteraceae bacterium]|nr:hypothetical protein [Candidatus Baltobacteraceae bacterium]